MDIFEEIAALKKEIERIDIQSAEELETFRIKFLGSKNILKSNFSKN